MRKLPPTAGEDLLELVMCRHRGGWVPVSPGSPVPRDPSGDFGTVLRPDRRVDRGAGPCRRC
jgi:hypothetical protein